MKTWVLLFLASACLGAATLVPLDCPIALHFPECTFTPPGGEVAEIPFTLFGELESGPVAQSIHQSSSFSFTSPDGFLVTEIVAFGTAEYNGFYTSVATYFTGPCGASFFATMLSSGSAACGTMARSGTITGFIDIRADAAPLHAQTDLGRAAITEFVFALSPVPVPEPALWP